VIRDGLKPGDRVVIEGTARIFVPGSPVTIDDGQATAGAAGGTPAAPPK
jgi:membrane fusion protein (multidrug efflux system)